MADDERRFALAEPQQRLIEKQVASGRHASGSDVVQEALRRYEADLANERTLQHLVEDGERDSARGAFAVVRDAAHLDAILDGASRRADQLLDQRQRRNTAA